MTEWTGGALKQCEDETSGAGSGHDGGHGRRWVANQDLSGTALSLLDIGGVDMPVTEATRITSGTSIGYVGAVDSVGRGRGERPCLWCRVEVECH